MEDINNRVKLILEAKKVSQSQFSKEIESTQQYISAVLKGDRKVGSNITDRILKSYPDINKYWLLTGEGKMFNDNWVERKDISTGFVESKTQRSKEFREVNKSNSEPTGYYLPDVSAAAGLETKVENDELKRIPVTIPGWEKDVLFINVYGDSMYPKYNAGEIIGVKYVEFQYLNYGSAYVVVFKNGDTYIKIVQPGTDIEHLLLESVNDFYKPKEYHINQLKSFYSIKGVIKKEMM